jgi:hypothetical protein
VQRDQRREELEKVRISLVLSLAEIVNVGLHESHFKISSRSALKLDRDGGSDHGSKSDPRIRLDVSGRHLFRSAELFRCFGGDAALVAIDSRRARDDRLPV